MEIKVNVNIKDLNNDLNQYDLQVFIEGDYNGKIYNVGYALQYTEGTLPKILSIVNS